MAQNWRLSSAHSAGERPAMEPIGWPSASSISVLGVPEFHRRRPSGDCTRSPRVVLFTGLPFQFSPWRPLVRYQIKGVWLCGGGEAELVGRIVGGGLCTDPVRNDQRTLICLCSPFPVQLSWSSSTW